MIEHDILHSLYHKNFEFLILRITAPSETRMYRTDDIIALANMEHAQARANIDHIHFLHIEPKTGIIPTSKTDSYDSEEELIEDTSKQTLNAIQEVGGSIDELNTTCRICYQHDILNSEIHYCEAMGDVHAQATAHELSLATCIHCKTLVQNRYQEIKGDLLNEQLIANLI